MFPFQRRSSYSSESSVDTLLVRNTRIWTQILSTSRSGKGAFVGAERVLLRFLIFNPLSLFAGKVIRSVSEGVKEAAISVPTQGHLK